MKSRDSRNPNAKDPKRLAGANRPAAVRQVRAICAIILVGSLSGCTRAIRPIRGAYAIEDQSGAPFLVPRSDVGEAQTAHRRAIITLEDGPAKYSPPAQCSAKSSLFALSPTQAQNQWEYGSPTAKEWAVQAIDIYQDWKIFLQNLDVLQHSGCFASTQDVFSLQRTLAAITTLPADEVDAYFYSDDKNGFVDLAPGMELLIQNVSIAHRRVESQGWAVVSRPNGGVALRLMPLAAKSRLFLNDNASGSVLNKYADKPYLRLFLEGSSDTQSERKPFLLGAIDLSTLDLSTQALEESGHRECLDIQKTVTCNLIPDGSVSLLIQLWVNGRRREYPLGTQLGRILPQRDEVVGSSIFKSLRLERSLPGGGSALVSFSRTPDGAMQVLLLVGDRISWTH